MESLLASLMQMSIYGSIAIILSGWHFLPVVRTWRCHAMKRSCESAEEILKNNTPIPYFLLHQEDKRWEACLWLSEKEIPKDAFFTC